MRELKGIAIAETTETEALVTEALTLQRDDTPVEVADKRILEINAKLTSLGVPSGGLLRSKSDIVEEKRLSDERGRKIGERNRQLREKYEAKQAEEEKKDRTIVGQNTGAYVSAEVTCDVEIDDEGE